MIIGTDEQRRDLILCDRGIFLGDFLNGTAQFEFVYDLSRGDARTKLSADHRLVFRRRSRRGRNAASPRRSFSRPSCMLIFFRTSTRNGRTVASVARVLKRFGGSARFT